ncbi:MAG: transglutaminase [Planctomycetota bacterium]|nr:MAG: transglutaminase [Planctomycetota bacterium]
MTSRPTRQTFAAFFIGLLIATCPLVHVQAENIDEIWQVNYIAGQRIGYQYGRERVELRDKKKIIISVSDSQTSLKRFGQVLKMSTSLRIEETESGDLLRFSLQIKNPPIQDSLTEGVVNGEHLELTTTLAGRTDNRRVPWEAGTMSPAFPDRWLRDHPLKPGESKSFKVYLPEFAKFSQQHFAADEVRPVKLLDGKEVPLLRVKVSFSAIPEIKPRQYVDATWRTKLTEIDMLGIDSRSYDVPRDVALQAIAGAELDLAVSTLVRIDPPILDAHRKKRIVYRVAMKEESPEPFFVAGGTQQIKPLIEKDSKDHAIELTVTAKPIPPIGSRPVKGDDRYLSPTRFLQTRDSAVVEHADRAAAGELDPSRIATRMERYVHEKLTKKNFSTAMASAAEVAQRMEGDCTEHAVLLAAMLRAKKVPSRVAAGLVYADKLNAFGGHMWTEAFLAGEWIPLDATLGKGGIGPAHLKMADSPLDEDAPLPVSTFLPAYQALGKLKIEVLKAE